MNVVTNSILFHLPVGIDPDHDDSVMSKRGHNVHKQAVAVTRLERERRSTPLQQTNDFRYVMSKPKSGLAPIVTFFDTTCTQVLWVSDAGWDHDPRNREVRFAHTLMHLDADRDADYHAVRNAGASGRSEAERVNGAETRAVAKGSVPTLQYDGAPMTTEGLMAAGRRFMWAVANAIEGAMYACKAVISLASFPGQRSSDHHSPQVRDEIRAVMAKANPPEGLPHQEIVANTEFYQEKHRVSDYYSNQTIRHLCLKTMGRLCCETDYPFPEALTFQACQDRPLRGPEPRVVPSIRLDPNRPGKLMTLADVLAQVETGAVDPLERADFPCQILKLHYKSNPWPTESECEALAVAVLGTRDKINDVKKYFEDRRLKKHVAAEEAAIAAPEGVAAQSVMERVAHRSTNISPKLAS